MSTFLTQHHASNEDAVGITITVWAKTNHPLFDVVRNTLDEVVHAAFTLGIVVVDDVDPDLEWEEGPFPLLCDDCKQHAAETEVQS